MPVGAACHGTVWVDMRIQSAGYGVDWRVHTAAAFILSRAKQSEGALALADCCWLLMTAGGFIFPRCGGFFFTCEVVALVHVFFI